MGKHEKDHSRSENQYFRSEKEDSSFEQHYTGREKHDSVGKNVLARQQAGSDHEAESLGLLNQDFIEIDESEDSSQAENSDFEDANSLSELAQNLENILKRKRSNTGSKNRSSKSNKVQTAWKLPKIVLEKNHTPEVARILHHEIVEYMKYIQPTRQENEVQKFAVKRVICCIKKLIPEAQCFVFGSSKTGLALPKADIDLVVFSEFFKTSSSSLKKVARGLSKEGIIKKKSLQVIATARVPLLKFKEMITDISIDISFNMDSGLKSLKEINYYLKQHPAARTLIILLKHLLKMRGLNDPANGGLGSYAISCMCISFLQLHPFLQSKQMKQENNLGVLFCELLELYGCSFNYNQVAILITEKGSYRPKPLHNNHFTMCILDPTENSNNISKAAKKINHIRSVLMGEFEILCQQLCAVSKQLKMQMQTMENNTLEIECPSILGSIIWSDPNVQTYRENIKIIYKQQHLNEPQNSDDQIKSKTAVLENL